MGKNEEAILNYVFEKLAKQRLVGLYD